MSILVVDDSHEILTLVQLILEKEGYCVDTLQQAGALSKQLSLKPYQLILLDMMMPKYTGDQCCAKIKANREWAHIPIIAFTAKPIKQNATLNTDFQGYLFKPFTADELIDCIEEHIVLDPVYILKI